MQSQKNTFEHLKENSTKFSLLNTQKLFIKLDVRFNRETREERKFGGPEEDRTTNQI